MLVPFDYESLKLIAVEAELGCPTLVILSKFLAGEHWEEDQREVDEDCDDTFQLVLGQH